MAGSERPEDQRGAGGRPKRYRAGSDAISTDGDLGGSGLSAIISDPGSLLQGFKPDPDVVYRELPVAAELIAHRDEIIVEPWETRTYRHATIRFEFPGIEPYEQVVRYRLEDESPEADVKALAANILSLIGEGDFTPLAGPGTYGRRHRAELAIPEGDLRSAFLDFCYLTEWNNEDQVSQEIRREMSAAERRLLSLATRIRIRDNKSPGSAGAIVEKINLDTSEFIKRTEEHNRKRRAEGLEKEIRVFQCYKWIVGGLRYIDQLRRSDKKPGCRERHARKIYELALERSPGDPKTNDQAPLRVLPAEGDVVKMIRHFDAGHNPEQSGLSWREYAQAHPKPIKTDP